MKWLKITNKRIILAVMMILITLLISLFFVLNKNKKIDSELLSEMLRAEELLKTREPSTENSGEDIDFKVFFLRDTDGDGYAEEKKEVYRQLGTNDTLFVDLNIKTQGYLKNGEITLESGGNFKWRTTLVNSNIIKGDYIGETNNIKLQDTLSNGTQILLYGTVISNIGNNIYNYDKTSTMKLTGTFVDEDGNETPVEKVEKVTMNWYGETNTTIYSTSQKYNINNAITEDKFIANFDISVSETKNQLLLQKQEAEAIIPEVNGYKATKVEVKSSNVKSNYDEETGILTISREATVDANGEIIKSINRNNPYNVEVTYPIEAYQEEGKDTLEIQIPITGRNYGFNNDKYTNPHISTDTTTINITYIKPDATVGEKKIVFDVYTYVGTYARSNYRVSKSGPINVYNGNIYNNEEDTYPVLWQAYVGDYEKIKNITLEENNSSDKFNNNQNMYEYETTTGVYFENATKILGDYGKIELYNAEEDTLIETFTKSTWETYTKANPYKTNIKSIKIVTSRPKENGMLSVYQIKKIDDEKIATKTEETGFTLDEFNELNRVYTYLKGSVEAPINTTYDNGKSTITITKENVALYEIPYSVNELALSTNEITNQKTNNMDLKIITSAANSFERIWKNGIFLIELPKDIIHVDIKDTTISNSNVKIKSSIVYEENGKKFIRVDTENEEEATYTITVNVDVDANPLLGDTSGTIELYAFNKFCDNYYNKKQDAYDIDADMLTTDYVGYSNQNIKIRAPQGLVTTEYVTEYDENGSITIAPNVAEIERADEKRKATVNVSIANNYANVIDEIKILGKIPFEGNTFVLNGQNQELNSEYTTNLTGPISIPEELQQYTTVYYSDVEKPTLDTSDSSNNWNTEVSDWTTIKTFLIDLGNYVLTDNGNKTFSYDVYVPAKLGYNTSSYATHAVYYSLHTDEDGKYTTATQPNKVGIQVVGKYNLELTKNKAGLSEIIVPGATYCLTTINEEQEINQIATTDANGKLVLKGVYIGREYTLKEISSPDDYELNEEVITFNTTFENEELTIDGDFITTPEITTDTNGNYYIKAKVEDEAKYTLTINKTDENNIPLNKVKFEISDGTTSKVYITYNGKINIDGLILNKEYTIREIEAEGYYIDQEPYTFKVTRIDETNELIL